MNNQFESHQSRLVGSLTLRAEQPDDESFLLEIYSDTRRAELDLSDWDAPTRRTFLQMQFRAMRQGYANMFPDATFSIVLLDGRSVGRLVIQRTPESVRLVDLAVVPSAQGQGIGTQLVRTLLAEAAETRKPVCLQVLKSNRAARLYQRLGFQKVGEFGPYELMERKPGD